MFLKPKGRGIGCFFSSVTFKRSIETLDSNANNQVSVTLMLLQGQASSKRFQGVYEEPLNKTQNSKLLILSSWTWKIEHDTHPRKYLIYRDTTGGKYFDTCWGDKNKEIYVCVSGKVWRLHSKGFFIALFLPPAGDEGGVTTNNKLMLIWKSQHVWNMGPLWYLPELFTWQWLFFILVFFLLSWSEIVKILKTAP